MFVGHLFGKVFVSRIVTHNIVRPLLGKDLRLRRIRADARGYEMKTYLASIYYLISALIGVIVLSGTIINASLSNVVLIRSAGTIGVQRAYNVNVLAWVDYYALNGVEDEKQVIAHVDKVRWVTAFGSGFTFPGTICDCTGNLSQNLVDVATSNDMGLLMRCGADGAEYTNLSGNADDILTNSSLSSFVMTSLLNRAESGEFKGIVIDWEGIQDSHQDLFVDFLTALKSGLGGKLLGVLVPAKCDDTIWLAYNYSRLGSIVDFLIPQMYEVTEDSFTRVMIYSTSVVPKEKICPDITLLDPVTELNDYVGIATNEFGIDKISVFRMDLGTDAFWDLIRQRYL
jgi:spore germination protein YaaH